MVQEQCLCGIRRGCMRICGCITVAPREIKAPRSYPHPAVVLQPSHEILRNAGRAAKVRHTLVACMAVLWNHRSLP